jgi:hypothetical protein
MNVFINQDFSASKVATITPPYIPVDEMVAYANAIPTTFATWTDTQKIAVNKFIKTLKTNSLFGSTKITKLYLPKIGRIDGGVNLITPSQNIGFPTSGATYTSNGVQFSAGWASGLSITYNNASFGFYNTVGRPTAEGDILSVGMGISSSAIWLGRRVSAPNRSGLLLASGFTNIVTINRSFSTGLVQCSITPTVQNAMVDGEFITVTQSYTPTTTGQLIFSDSTAGGTSRLFNAPVGMYYVSATPLSQTEMAVINSAITTLISVI